MQFNILVVVTEHNEVHRMWVKRTKKFTTQRKCINNAITNTHTFTPSTSTTRQPSSTSGFCSLYCFCYWLALFVWVLWAHARIFNAYIFTFIGHVKSKTWFFVCLLLCGNALCCAIHFRAFRQRAAHEHSYKRSGYTAIKKKYMHSAHCLWKSCQINALRVYADRVLTKHTAHRFTVSEGRTGVSVFQEQFRK